MSTWLVLVLFDCYLQNANHGCLEVSLHILSHLPATDLLTVKLVSRRLYSLVNSPHAWISAFSQYFPGPRILKRDFSVIRANDDDDSLVTEKRAFTRLSAVPSWTGEYLLRTKLLRCLIRGRPSLPLVAPSQGKLHKGYAIFTYASKVGIITTMGAKFGLMGDKRLPQYMHGSALNGAVSLSDRRGELAGWGLRQTDTNIRSFTDLYPGSTPWGLGAGDVVGMPNLMEVSTENGMLYAEAFPDGLITFLPTNEKRVKYLSPFLGIANHDQNIPRISQDVDTTCSIWLAKTLNVSRTTKGLVGILCGSSSGVVSAYSLGTPGGRDQRLDKGELTARWLLTPGVPIIKITADDNYNLERSQQGRIWAVAINALGEVFYMRDLPIRATIVDGPAEHFEANHEVRSWLTGRSTPWQLLLASQRQHRPFSPEDRGRPMYYPDAIWHNPDIADGQAATSMKALQAWISKSPLEMQGNFDGWDMQRQLEVDFAGDDGIGAGENIVVVRCGSEEDVDQTASMIRYTRIGQVTDLASSEATLTSTPTVSETASEWRCSDLTFGRAKTCSITVTALDRSAYAMTTAADDVAAKTSRRNEEHAAKQSTFSLDVDKHSPFKIPGQRARFVAVGTGNGQVFVWDIRASGPSSASITNQITPVRVIQTDSPEISSLALTSLYLVHGGSDGLVQAWDPLGSTDGPIRTISSALSGRMLRQAQQDPITQTRGIWAAGAICLDPEPGNLRGIVALRGTLRYWSYSSSSASKPSAKTKRKIHRSARGLNSPTTGDGFTSGRRVDLKGLVNAELSARNIDEADKRADAKAHKRFAGRFGLDLLGEDASEEELIAYATMLSQEEEEQRAVQAAAKRVTRDSSEEEIEQHLQGLSEDDREKWRFASWDERFEMSASPAATVMGTPAMRPKQEHMDDDIARALELSLRESRHTSASPSYAAASASKRHATAGDEVDDDVAEAIARSLAQDEQPRAETSPFASPSPASNTRYEAEDDLERAIRLSLEESGSSPSTDKAARRGSSFADDDFPALSSSPQSSPPNSGWKKGKRRAW